MKYNKNTIIWDVDGTLVDSSQGLIASYEHVFNLLKIPLPSQVEIQSFIGPTPKKIFAEHFAMSEFEAQHAMDIFREYYKNNQVYNAVLYKDIFTVLETFKGKGFKQAIATNKREDYATLLCKHFGFDKFCFPICGTDSACTITKSDLIAKCFKKLSIYDLSQVIMIGDTVHDQEAACSQGIDFLGVGYGFGFFNDVAKIQQPLDILKHISYVC